MECLFWLPLSFRCWPVFGEFCADELESLSPRSPPLLSNSRSLLSCPMLALFLVALLVPASSAVARSSSCSCPPPFALLPEALDGREVAVVLADGLKGTGLDGQQRFCLTTPNLGAFVEQREQVKQAAFCHGSGHALLLLCGGLGLPLLPANLAMARHLAELGWPGKI